MTITKALIKWAGGKSKLLPTILPELTGDRLIEPFVGSGVVFLNAPQKDIIINDFNPDLTNLFKQVSLNYLRLVNATRKLFSQNTQADYTALRLEFNSTNKTTLRRAALFIYLNRHCFNGLCRYNSSGGFNVPYGKYKTPYFPEEEILEIYRYIKELDFFYILNKDFADVMKLAGSGDVVYCDPPYVPETATSFTNYTGIGFSLKDQQRLVVEAEAARNRGAKVVISNLDTTVSRQLYQNATSIIELQVQRSISASGSSDSRKKVSELIALF